MPADNEIELYVVNDGDIYRSHTRPLYQRLALEKLRGNYDRLRALKGFDAIINEGVRRYRREFGSAPFSVSEKKDAASSMLQYFETEYQLGNIKADVPRSSQPKRNGSGKTSAQLDREIDESLKSKRR